MLWVWYNITWMSERGKRNSPATMRLQITFDWDFWDYCRPVGGGDFSNSLPLSHIFLSPVYRLWCDHKHTAAGWEKTWQIDQNLIYFRCEGERGSEIPDQQTSPVSNVSARVSDLLSHTKQGERPVRSILWWGFDSLSREPFSHYFVTIA